MAVRALAVLLAVALSACGKSKGAADAGYSANIDPQGTLLEFEGFQLSIPPGAVNAAVEIRIFAGDYGAPDVPDRVRVSRVFVVQPDGLELNAPATAVVPYLPALIPNSVPATATDARRTDFSRAMERLDAVTVNEAAKTVAGETMKLGTFWATAPAGPRPAVITLTPTAVSIPQGGSTVLDAEVRDQNGRIMPGQPVVWSSSDATVARVDTRGMVSGVYPGVVQIVAKAGAAQAKAKVLVTGTDPFPNSFGWENPLPEGNPLYAVGGDLDALYVGGDNGLLLRQNAQGWSSLYSTLGARLGCIASGPAGVVAGGHRDTDGVLVFSIGGGEPHDKLIPDTLINGVWVGSGTAMAVGDGPDVAIMDAQGNWTTLPSPVSEPLLAVDGSGGAPVVVGARGAVYKRQGSAWVALSMDPLPQYQLAAVVHGEEAWAISQTSLRRFAQGAWTTQALSLPEGAAIQFEVLGLAGATPIIGGKDLMGQAYVVVVGSTAVVHSLGSDHVTALWGRGTNDLFAVSDTGAMRHWDGKAWGELRQGITSDIVALSALPGPRVFAASNVCSDATCATRTGLVLDRDAASGSFRPLGASITAQLTGLAARSPTDIWAVATNGNAYHYDGTAWTSSTVSGGTTLYAVAACPKATWATGSGRVYRESNGVWSTVANTGSSRNRGLACAGEGVVVAGDYLITAIDKNGVATSIDSVDGLERAPWDAVWANASGQAFVAGDAGAILWWDGDALSKYDRPGNVPIKSVKALWGTSFGSLWAAGTRPDASGFLLHFNGAEWVEMNAGTSLGLYSLTGLATGELWVGGARGAILHAGLPVP